MSLLRGLGIGLLLMAAGVLATGAAYVLWKPGPVEPDRVWNRDRNALWLAHAWLGEPREEREIRDLLERLRDLGISAVFPHLAPADRGGRLPPFRTEDAERFLRVARDVSPDLRVLPWVGGVVTGHRGDMPGTIDLRDADQRRVFAAECRRLVELGFDGVHVNIEPVPSGSPEYLALLHEVRGALPEGAILSIAAARPSTFATVNPRPHHSWDRAYFGAVASFVDQVVVMGYDTGIPLRKWYTSHLADSTRAIAAEIHRSNPGCRLLMGVPTFTKRRIARNRIENLRSALQGVKRGLEDCGPETREIVDGVALYAEWTTDEEEWGVFRALWRGEPQR